MIEIIVGLATVGITILVIFAILDAKINKKAKKNLNFDQNIENEITQEENYSDKKIDLEKIINTPVSIWQVLKKFPIEQSREMLKDCIGLNVKWQGSLSDVNNLSQTKAILTFKHTDWGQYTVICMVNISDYPDLKVTRNIMIMNIRGKIAEISSDNVRLDNGRIVG